MCRDNNTNTNHNNDRIITCQEKAKQTAHLVFYICKKALTSRRTSTPPAHLEVRVGGRRPVALHVDQPRGRRVLRHAQSSLEFAAENAGLRIPDLGLKLLALVVHISNLGHIGLGLVLEEGVVQHLVVDVQLAHLGLHAVALLLLQLLL